MKRLAIWTVLLLIVASAGGASNSSGSAATNTYWEDGVQAVLPAHAATGDHQVVTISSVSCTSAGDCSAVGSYRNEAGRPEGLLLTETNGFWESGIEAVLPAGTIADQLVDLNSVSCSSAGNCSAVGSYYDDSGQEGLLLTETGGTWAPGLEAALPANAAVTNYGGAAVSSVSCGSAGNCSAVGAYTDGPGAYAALLLKETAGSWETGVEATLPANATGEAAGLNSVSCSSVGNCSAIGSYLDSSGNGPGLLLTETAGTWGTGVEATLPTNAATTEQFVDMASVSCASAGNCSAVGTYNNDTHSNDAVLLNETAGTWMPGVKAVLPANGAKDDQVDLHAVSCASATSCAAVGDYVDHAGNIRGLLLTRTADKWSKGLEAVLPANATTEAPNQLGGLWSVSCASAGNCSAVGSYNDRAERFEGLMVSERGGSWKTGVEAVMRKHARYVAGRLLSVSCSSAQYCSAVGGFEQVKGALFNSSPTLPCLVPTLKGRPVRVAKEAIRAHDCSVGKVTRATSRSIKKGRVISARPRAGTRLDRNARINLVVSRGRGR